MSLVNHITHKDGKIVVKVEKIGNKKREIKQALTRVFHNDTFKIRSGLIAANAVNPNKNHPHYRKYLEKSKEMSVKYEEIGDFEVKVTIEK